MSNVRVRFLLVPLLALAATACSSGLVALGANVAGAALPAPRDRETEVRFGAQIREVDALQHRLVVTTDDGRTGTVRYDNATVIVRDQEHHPVSILEPADRVLIQARQDSQGQLIAARIDLHQPARTGVEEVEVTEVAGSILRADHEAGVLVVTTATGDVTVSIPSTAPQATLAYFRRLRVGGAVRLEAVPAAAGGLEIHRFL